MPGRNGLGHVAEGDVRVRVKPQDADWGRLLLASLWKRLFWKHLCRAALGAAARRRAPHGQFVSSLANLPGRFGFSVPGRNGPGQHGETPRHAQH